jgi:hypothetical protein
MRGRLGLQGLVVVGVADVDGAVTVVAGVRDGGLLVVATVVVLGGRAR